MLLFLKNNLILVKQNYFTGILTVYRLPRLTKDLERFRTEKEDLEHRLEEAERENHEYRRQNACASDRQAGDKGKDESSEIHKLKHELDSTRRELDKTRLR